MEKGRLAIHNKIYIFHLLITKTRTFRYRVILRILNDAEF
jgi:hypothetical protein